MTVHIVREIHCHGAVVGQREATSDITRAYKKSKRDEGGEMVEFRVGDKN
jgi:hypothetical protein